MSGLIEVADISRFNSMNHFEAYISQVALPPWSTPIILMAIVGQDGNEIQIIGNAPIKKKSGVDHSSCYNALKELSKERVYVFSVPGSCVKMNLNKKKTGFGHPCEIKSQYPFEVKLSTNGFVPAIKYNLFHF